MVSLCELVMGVTPPSTNAKSESSAIMVRPSRKTESTLCLITVHVSSPLHQCTGRLKPHARAWFSHHLRHFLVVPFCDVTFPSKKHQNLLASVFWWVQKIDRVLGRKPPVPPSHFRRPLGCRHLRRAMVADGVQLRLARAESQNQVQQPYLRHQTPRARFAW